MQCFSARFSLCLLALSLAVLVAMPATPANAEVYHVKLHNGSVIDTAYQPVQCTWDPNMVLIMTDVGNWIGLDQKAIESVESETQVRGFGVAINTSTIAIGWAPNDAADPSTLTPPSATDLAIQKLLQDQQQRANYSVQQGVSSEQTQGIPSGLAGYGGIPTQVLPTNRPPSTPAPAAAAPASPGPGR